MARKDETVSKLNVGAPKAVAEIAHEKKAVGRRQKKVVVEDLCERFNTASRPWVPKEDSSPEA